MNRLPDVVLAACREYGIQPDEVRMWVLTDELLRIKTRDGRKLELRRLPGLGPAEPTRRE
jgi:hypothetical protein